MIGWVASLNVPPGTRHCAWKVTLKATLVQAGEIATLLSLKVTVPVGEPLAAETVAVKVTGSVGADGFIEDTSAVVVAVWLTT